MGVSVEEEFGGAEFRGAWRNVDQTEGEARAIERHFHRPRLEEVVVPFHHDYWRPDPVDRFKGPGSADIP